MKQYAYHCTNVDPQLIIADGFKATEKGYTGTNVLKHFYKQYLPKNPMFVSSLKAKVWDPKAKYCMKVDISGLKKYPDFGHLLDFGAYFDEECFWWENEVELQYWLVSRDETKRRLADFVLNQLNDGVLYSADFTGEMSFNILGTCAIDGDQLNASRIIEVKSH